MPLLHPSYIYLDSPPDAKSILEARVMHFCLSPMLRSIHSLNANYYERVGPWIVLKVPRDTPSASAFGNDVIHGGLPAHTNLEAHVNGYIHTLVGWGGQLEGWRPRIRNYHGNGHCFDVFFVGHKLSECANKVEEPTDAPAPVTRRPNPPVELPPVAIERWYPPLEMENRDSLTPTQAPQVQVDEAPETASASEESSAREDSSSEDMTSDSDSDPDYVPPARETRSRRAARSPSHSPSHSPSPTDADTGAPDESESADDVRETFERWRQSMTERFRREYL